ncbi:MAG: response regulator [Desulfobacterales bacterium]|nr:response regulator [Desulfobacterales bacterium]
MRILNSFKKAIISKFVILAFLPISLFGLIALKMFHDNLEKEISLKNFLIAKSLADEVERFLNEPVIIINQLHDVIFENKLISPENINRYLATSIKIYNLIEMVQILDENGTVTHVAPMNNDYIGINLSSAPFYKKEEREAAISWTNTFISMQTGSPTVALTKSCNHGLIIEYLNLNSLNDMIEKVKINSSAYATICDQYGTIIAHPDRDFVLERFNIMDIDIIRNALTLKQEGTSQYISDEKKLGSTAIIQSTGWVVGVHQSSDYAFMEVRKLRNIFIATIIFSLSLAALMTIYSLKNTLKPFSNLIDNTKKIGQADYNFPPLAKSYTEIDNLWENFKSMAYAIKQRENSIKESEDRYKTLISTIPYGIVEITKEGIITFTNPIMLSIYGYEKKEFLGKSIFDFIESNEEKLDFKLYLNTMTILQGHPTNLFLKNVRSNGNIIHTRIDWNYIRNSYEEITGFILVLTDITKEVLAKQEYKELEEKLTKAHKTEAIGTLAGGISHDFNNILFLIMGYTELLMSEVSKKSPTWNYLEVIYNSGKKARDIVKKILTFSRMKIGEKKPILIQPVIEEVLAIIKPSLTSTITINAEIDENCPCVLGNTSELHQIIINLCTNACYSMKEKGGKLTITLKQITIKPNDIKKITSGLYVGNYVMLSVQDTGDGIDESILEQIFDPYFTTKKVGEGSGLGLSVVQGIINKYNGHIAVNTQKGKGSTFDVYFPAIHSNDDSINHPANSIEDNANNGKLILIVDDEKLIVKMQKFVLEKLGYKIEAKYSGVEALEAFKKNPSMFDLVITDMNMPFMSGFELSKELIKIRPDIPIILCTGYNEIDEKTAKSIGIKKYVPRPIRVVELVDIIKNVLNDY